MEREGPTKGYENKIRIDVSIMVVESLSEEISFELDELIDFSR